MLLESSIAMATSGNPWAINYGITVCWACWADKVLIRTKLVWISANDMSLLLFVVLDTFYSTSGFGFYSFYVPVQYAW